MDEEADLLRPINGGEKANPGGGYLERWSGKSPEFRHRVVGFTSAILLAIICVLVFILIPLLEAPPPCNNSACKYSVVESIPYGMNKTLVTRYPICDAITNLISSAKTSVDIACLYMTLEGHDFPGQGESKGRAVFQAIMDAGTKRKVKVRIAMNKPSDDQVSEGYLDDLYKLRDAGAAEVRLIDMDKLTGGVLHTKVVLVDGAAFFQGSANMDWRSFSQVKELGMHVWECPCLTADLEKSFEIYWQAGLSSDAFPPTWPSTVSTRMNENTPAEVKMNGEVGEVYFCNAPLAMCGGGRSFDRNCIVDLMNNAKERISIEVMDYSPTTLYTNPRIYWPYFDDALRAAAFRGVHVRFIAALWNHTHPGMIEYLRSLDILDGIDVRLFVVPPINSIDMPFTRVNHAKFMVTDKKVLIGTSNWSADYFVNTAGISFVSTHFMIRDDVQNKFFRDWDSSYAFPMNATWPPPITRHHYSWGDSY